MKIQKSHFWMWMLCVGVLLGVTVVGCGGGSSGTGGQQYQGTILSRTSQPLPGVKVTIAQSGDNTVTDTNGYYSVITDAGSGSVTYIFEAPGIQIQFTLEGVPGNASVVTVNFVLDEQEQSADPTLVDIDENDSSSSDDDNGSSASSDDNSSSSDDDGSSSSDSSNDDGSSSSDGSSASSEDDSSASSESSSESSESSSSSSDDDGEGSGGGSGSGGSGSGGSGSGGSSSSSSSDD